MNAHAKRCLGTLTTFEKYEKATAQLQENEDEPNDDENDEGKSEAEDAETTNPAIVLPLIKLGLST